MILEIKGRRRRTTITTTKNKNKNKKTEVNMKPVIENNRKTNRKLKEHENMRK